MSLATAETGFFVSGGTVPLGAASYVARDADRELLRALQTGQYCYVLTSRQMGKSSLSVRTMETLRAEGARTAFVDLTRVGGRNVTPDQWYAGLLGEIGRGLGRRAEMLAHWKAHAEIGPMQRFFGALREVALSDPAPLAVFIDEIDATRSLPFSTDEFFAGIRECFNHRVEDPAMGRLAFCLIGVAIPSDLMSDAKLTPFNVGVRVVLRDFELAEAMALAEGLGDHGKRLIERIVHWTGGHPFLTQSLGRKISEAGVSSPADVDRLVADELFEARARETNINLADVGNRVLNSFDDPDAVPKYRADVLSLYESVLKGRRVLDDESNRLVAVLKLAGLVKPVGGVLKVRNRIYERVFGPEWLQEQMPDQELRRQRQAYRIGVIRTGALATAMLAVVGFLAGVAVRNARVANESALVARRALAAEHDALAAKSSALEEVGAERDRARKSEAQAKSARDLARAQERKTAAALQDAQTQKERADDQTRLARRNENVANAATRSAAAAAHHALASAADATREGKRADAQSNEAYLSGIRSADLAFKGGRPDLARNILRSLRRSEWRSWEYDHLSTRLVLPARSGPPPQTTIATHVGEVAALAFTADGERVVAAGHDGRFAVWRAADGAPVATYEIASARRSRASVLLPDGSGAVVAFDDDSLALVDFAGGKARWTVQGVPGMGALVVSPDGDAVAAGGASGLVRRWRVADGALVDSATMPGVATVCSLAWSPLVEVLAACDRKGDVALWTPSKKEAKAFVQDSRPVRVVAFSYDGKQIALGTEDGSVDVWGTEDAQSISSWNAGGSPVVALGSAPGGGTEGMFAAVGTRDTARLMAPSHYLDMGDPRDRNPISATALAFSPAGDRLAVGGNDGQLRLFDTQAEAGPGVRIVDRHASSANAFSISHDGRLLATVDNDRVSLLDRTTNRRIWRSETEGWYLGVGLSPDGKWVAASNYANGTVDVLNAANGRRVANVPGQYTCAFSPDSRMLAIGGPGVGVYDTRTWQPIRRMDTNLKVVGVAFSRDGRTMVTGSEGGGVDRRRVGDWTLLNHYPIDNSADWVSFSPDERRLVASGPGGTFVWEVESGKPVAWRLDPNGGSMAVFSPDGRRIVSLAQEGADAAVVVWDLATQRSLLSVPLPKGGGRYLAFAPDRKAYVALGDGTVRALMPLDAAGYMALDEADRKADAEEASQNRRLAVAGAAQAKEEAAAKARRLLQDEINTRLAKRDWAGAARMLDDLIASAPAAREPREERAFALANLGRYADAERDLRDLATHPGGGSYEMQKYQYPLVVAAQGHLAAYRKLRHVLLVEPDAGRTGTTIRYMLLAGAFPAPFDDAERAALALAVALPVPVPESAGDIWLAYSALALHRLGRDGEAAERIEFFRKSAGALPPARLVASLASVLVAESLGQPERARAEWNALQPQMRDMEASYRAGGQIWSFMLPVRRLRDEAARLLAPSPPGAGG